MSSNLFGLIGKLKAPLVIAITSGYFALDTYRMKNAKESEICVQLRGKPVLGVLGDVPCVSPYLQEMIDEVKSGLNLPLNKKKVLNYYVTPYPKPKVNGFYSTFSQIDIFLPDYFNISSGEQLTAQAISNLVELMGENFDSMSKDDWLTPDGKAFISSFLLSRRAKKFLITQTSYSNLNSEYHLKYLIFGLITTAFIVSMIVVDEKVKGSVGVKLGFSILMVIPLILLKKLLSCHSEMICETKGLASAITRNMASLKELVESEDKSTVDEEMLLGALEYYSKLLLRQKAASRLFSNGFSVFQSLGEDGESINPFQLELPKSQIISKLEAVKSHLKTRKNNH